MAMAGPRRLLLLPPLTLVLLVAAAGVLLLPAQRGSAEEEGKVSLELYYESLCPYCSRFIVNHLAGIFEDGLIDAVHLRLVPYGNARVGSNSEISCQVPKFIMTAILPSSSQNLSRLLHWFAYNLLMLEGSTTILCAR